MICSYAWVWRRSNSRTVCWRTRRSRVLMCSLRMIMTSDRCNRYKQITMFYLLNVLEYNIHKTSKEIECWRHCCDPYSYTSPIFPSHSIGENFRFVFWPGDFVAKAKQINSQSNLISMSNFAGPSYLTIISSVYIILIWDPCIFDLYNLCQIRSNYVHRTPDQCALDFNEK